jgi:hypothetical protein
VVLRGLFPLIGITLVTLSNVSVEVGLVHFVLMVILLVRAEVDIQNFQI